ncbi:MAG TPA: ATP-binding protein [Thermoanaerobaculia bacterium]|nr:ATP-binding protein [Thermoanaerobaculia bacterium]
MSARIDLTELSQRENEQTEWKENVADIDDVVATLSAFANDFQNLGGGYVVCGAKEEKDADGFPRLVRMGLTASRIREVENTVLARCRDRVSPPLVPLVEELPTDDTSRRVLVFLQPATGAAHTFRRGREGAKHYVRVSRSTIEARNGVLRELLVRRGALEPWDRRPCNGATTNDLDLLALRDALQRTGVFTPERGVEPYLVAGVQITPFVPSLCIAEPLTGVVRPRNYAILLFGREPQKFVPGAFSIYSTYPGRDRTYPVARRLEIAGTLLDQAKRVQEMLDLEAVTIFDKTDLKTPNVEKYPRRALQEAMVNALAHRDYELFDPARFTSYQDRIEFISPGKLLTGMTIEDLRKRRVTPLWRNQSLAWFLSRLQFAQAEGQGIQTIRSAMKAAGCPPPRFEATEVSVTCILRAHPRSRVVGVPATKT